MPAFMQDAIYEERRGAENHSRGFAAGDVARDAGGDVVASAVLVEACDVEAQLVRICAQCFVFKCLLAMKQQGVHLPEASLPCCRFGRRGGRERMWVYLR